MERFEAGGRPGATSQIVERDDGLIESTDMAHYFAEYDDWRDPERWACASLSGRILDIGAGAGRHSLFLQQQGCEVTALDVSPRAAEVCSRRGVRNVFTGTIEDLAATDPRPFDAFVLLGGNLGLLRSREYAPRFLQTLAAMSHPAAVIVGACVDPYETTRVEHLEYHERNRAAGRMPGQVRLRIRHRRLATPWWELLFCSIGELAELVDGTGWRIDGERTDGAMYVARLRLVHE